MPFLARFEQCFQALGGGSSTWRRSRDAALGGAWRLGGRLTTWDRTARATRRLCACDSVHGVSLLLIFAAVGGGRRTAQCRQCQAPRPVSEPHTASQASWLLGCYRSHCEGHGGVQRDGAANGQKLGREARPGGGNTRPAQRGRPEAVLCSLDQRTRSRPFLSSQMLPCRPHLGAAAGPLESLATHGLSKPCEGRSPGPDEAGGPCMSWKLLGHPWHLFHLQAGRLGFQAGAGGKQVVPTSWGIYPVLLAVENLSKLLGPSLSQTDQSFALTVVLFLFSSSALHFTELCSLRSLVW
ncbi:hypothetical protein GQ53DRAFT_33384 [Thozetella sp. PMI_491]|nr:hypothetical protein GQ53DRAFT_33384 [Thozetella sp. PMI_491]